MQLLQNGVDRTVIALWLGHESVETTQMYIHADIQPKEKAMARTAPLTAPPGRYRPDDTLLAFLHRSPCPRQPIPQPSRGRPDRLARTLTEPVCPAEPVGYTVG
jgi:hypothetical protein